MGTVWDTVPIMNPAPRISNRAAQARPAISASRRLGSDVGTRPAARPRQQQGQPGEPRDGQPDADLERRGIVPVDESVLARRDRAPRITPLIFRISAGRPSTVSPQPG